MGSTCQSAVQGGLLAVGPRPTWLAIPRLPVIAAKFDVNVAVCESAEGNAIHLYTQGETEGLFITAMGSATCVFLYNRRGNERWTVCNPQGVEGMDRRINIDFQRARPCR